MNNNTNWNTWVLVFILFGRQRPGEAALTSSFNLVIFFVKISKVFIISALSSDFIALFFSSFEINIWQNFKNKYMTHSYYYLKSKHGKVNINNCYFMYSWQGLQSLRQQNSRLVMLTISIQVLILVYVVKNYITT